MRPSDLVKSTPEDIAIDYMAMTVALENAAAQLSGADMPSTAAWAVGRLM